jgi:hypothetical protein
MEALVGGFFLRCQRDGEVGRRGQGNRLSYAGILFEYEQVACKRRVKGSEVHPAILSSIE